MSGKPEWKAGFWAISSISALWLIWAGWAENAIFLGDIVDAVFSGAAAFLADAAESAVGGFDRSAGICGDGLAFSELDCVFMRPLCHKLGKGVSAAKAITAITLRIFRAPLKIFLILRFMRELSKAEKQDQIFKINQITEWEGFARRTRRGAFGGGTRGSLGRGT
jgi:hypothetical protein